MITSILLLGGIVFLGLILLFVKLPPRKMLWLLGRPLLLDVSITTLAFASHWGTLTGLMSAAFTGVLSAISTGFMRRAIGYLDKSPKGASWKLGHLYYHRGWFYFYRPEDCK